MKYQLVAFGPATGNFLQRDEVTAEQLKLLIKDQQADNLVRYLLRLRELLATIE